MIGIALTGLTVNFNACDTNSPMSSQNEAKTGKTAQSNLGTIDILKMNEQAHQSLLNGGSKDSVFYAEKLIKANKGGEIKNTSLAMRWRGVIRVQRLHTSVSACRRATTF